VTRGDKGHDIFAASVVQIKSKQAKIGLFVEIGVISE
jgi:hypothetical protein